MAGFAAALAAALFTVAMGEAMRRPLFDSWQRFSPRDLSNTNVYVVLIDSESLAAVGPWPWPRYHLARLTEEIASHHPVAIGFDMIFAEPDRLKPTIFASMYPELSSSAVTEIAGLEPMDQLFGKVIGKAPVVLGRAAIDGKGARPEDLPIEAEFSGKLPPAIRSYPGAIANIPELEHVALGHGLLNGPPDSDGTIRRVPLITKVSGRPMPGLALELARVDRQLDAIGVARDEIMLGNHRVTVDDQGRMMLRLGDFPASHISSAANVLRRNFHGDTFGGKIVLVGLAAEGTADIVATPLAAESYGTLVQAQALDIILRGGWLARPGWVLAVEWSTGAMLALLILLFVPGGGRGIVAVPAVLAAAIPIACWFTFDMASLLIDPLRPLMIGGGAVAGVLGAMFVEARHERERLRETLVQERIIAAAAEGELEAARAIQLGMLPTAEGLARLDRRVDLYALLEPAKSVGGDFYDIARVQQDIVGFVIGDVTGKGVPAALFMALSKALTKSVMLREAADLARAAVMLNEELSRDNSEAMGVTMLLGLLDMRTGVVAMVNAGHEDPLLMQSEGLVAQHSMEGGPPFCVVDYPYPVETLTLLPGETLILITDGVTEAQDAAGALFGRGRTLATVEGHLGGAAEIAEAVRQAVRQFEAGAEASDDLTVMAIRYLG